MTRPTIMVRLHRPGKLTRIKRLPWMDIPTAMTWPNREISMRMVAWPTCVDGRTRAKCGGGGQYVHYDYDSLGG